MFRALIGAAALASAATGAAYAQTSGATGGLTVFGQPRDAYTIVIPTLGKDKLTVQREISSAAHVACRYAPTGRG